MVKVVNQEGDHGEEIGNGWFYWLLIASFLVSGPREGLLNFLLFERAGSLLQCLRDKLFFCFLKECGWVPFGSDG